MKGVAVLPCLFAIALPILAYGSLTPSDVIVLYNSDPYWSDVSEAVADYYCAARGIPQSNKLGVCVPFAGETIAPSDLAHYILGDQVSNPGLRTFLSSRPGFDINDPGTDPTKAIVLCYGVPLKIGGEERNGSVDSTLSLLFSTAPWGREPIGDYCNGALQDHVLNPYYEHTYPGCPWERTKPTDFSEFRESNYNDTPEDPPGFTIARMLDSSHALAGGERGILYRGVRTGSAWEWSPVADRDKGSIASQINDIYVLDSQHAWVCTDKGSLITTADGGQTWTRLVNAWVEYSGAANCYKGAWFYDSGNGFAVGRWNGTQPSGQPQCFVLKFVGGSFVGRWGDLPVTFSPTAVAAVDGDHVWVSGYDVYNSVNRGIWRSDNGGVNWTQRYNAAVVTRVWVKWVTDHYEGWAINAENKVLHTTDGSTWSEAHTLPANATDMAVVDESHVAFAYGGWPVFYDDGQWTTDQSDASGAKESVAWDGTGHSVAAVRSPSSIRAGEGSPGAFAWGESYVTPQAHWKLRYLVCRLDGYASPVDEVTGIPSDVKNMIDRAVSADAAGRSALTNAKVVLDDPWSQGPGISEGFLSCAGELVGQSNVIYDNTGTYVTGDYELSDQTLLSEHNVIAYTSPGSYHWWANSFTTWQRPFLSWQDGAIGMFNMVSGDMFSIRSPSFLTGMRRDEATQNVESDTLKVYLWYLWPEEQTALYASHWVGLHASDGSLLASANFAQTETVTNNAFTPSTRDVRIATIDLNAISWPTDHQTYVAVHFPNDDTGHPGQVMAQAPSAGSTSDAVWQARSTGITYYGKVGQSLTIDLVRDSGSVAAKGCTAVAGNVYEPFQSACPQPAAIIPHYLTGRTWAESAYLGFPYLSWMEVAVGDPLMAPYQIHPTIAFQPPTPPDGSHVTGPVTIQASATPSGRGSIRRVEFWLGGASAQTRLASIYTAPYVCKWDALATSGGSRVYPDGNYTIEAIAFQDGEDAGSSAISRAVVLDSAAVSTVGISEPDVEDAVVSEATPVEAQAGGTPTNVGFWLFADGVATQVGQDSTPPCQCAIGLSLIDDGVYDLQAVAYYGSPAASASYSPRRRIIVCNGVTPFTSVISGASAADATDLMLANVPVSAGTSDAMEGAFYVEDPSRATGIRVEWGQPVAAGRRVVVLGAMHKAGTAERHIDATAVWDMGESAIPQPVGITNLWFGGSPPSDSPGITGAYGLYNTGLLVRIWGNVTYVGDDFVYVDDGSGWQDGNTLEGPIDVPFDEPIGGGDIPTVHPAVKGVKVRYGSLTKPGIGDHVAIRGVSSVQSLGSSIVRLLRVTDAQSTSYYDSYTTALRCSAPGYMVGPDLATPLPVGCRVRLTDNVVDSVYSDHLLVSQTQQLPFLTEVEPAYTQLLGSEVVTINGVFSSTIGQWWGIPAVRPERIYLGGSACGAMALSTRLSSTSGSSSPSQAVLWPYPSPDEVVASPAFQRQDARPGCIGWALTQPDGTVIDLVGERITERWYDGQALGLREVYEPLTGDLRLLLYLSRGIDGLSQWRQIDIEGGTVATLANGQRAVLYPRAVYVYEDSRGGWMPMVPKVLDASGELLGQTSRRQVYP